MHGGKDQDDSSLRRGEWWGPLPSTLLGVGSRRLNGKPSRTVGSQELKSPKFCSEDLIVFSIQDLSGSFI